MKFWKLLCLTIALGYSKNCNKNKEIVLGGYQSIFNFSSAPASDSLCASNLILCMQFSHICALIDIKHTCYHCAIIQLVHRKITELKVLLYFDLMRMKIHRGSTMQPSKKVAPASPSNQDWFALLSIVFKNR